ncbi:unnamed protein product, partial [Allacma fusca]
MSALWPFVNVFAKQLGISSMETGLIFGAAPVVATIAKPLFGAIGDRFKKKKIIFLFFILLNLISCACMAFLEQKRPGRPVIFKCTYAGTSIRQCGSVNAHCNESIIDTFKTIKRNTSDLVSPPTALFNQAPAEIDGSRFEECYVECEIHSFAHGVKFCSSILGNNAPGVCGLWGCRDNFASEYDSHSEHQHGSYSDEEDYSDPSLYLQPTILQFSVQLKIWDAIFLPGLHGDVAKNCLILPVETVAFEGESGRAGLSCLNSSILPYCFIDCPNNPALNSHLERVVEHVDVYGSVNFWLYGTLIIFSFVAMAVVASTGDALCFQLLGDKPQYYGSQRLYGAIGWGLFALISGFLIDTVSGTKLLKDYTPAFYLMAGMLVLDLVVSYKWDVKEFDKPKSLRRNVSTLLTDLRIIVFIAACIIIGMCTGLQWNFLMWHVEILAEEGEENCDVHDTRVKTLQGLLSAVQCFVGELPFFYLSGWFIKKLGQIHCITMVLGVFGVRFILYSVIKNPWMLLPVEVLQGLTFGVFYSAMTSYANKVSPTGTSATVQGIFGAAFEGLGVAGGSLVGGLMFNAYGGAQAFLIFGCGAFVFAVLHCLIMFALNQSSSYRGVQLGIRETEGQEMHQITASNLEVDSE